MTESSEQPTMRINILIRKLIERLIARFKIAEILGNLGVEVVGKPSMTFKGVRVEIKQDPDLLESKIISALDKIGVSARGVIEEVI